MVLIPFQCLYSEDQVRFLCHIGHLFKDALYTEQTECFMQELFVLWFHDWPEAPEHVERCKNVSVFDSSTLSRSNVIIHLQSLRRAMLAVSHECTPDLTFIQEGIAPQFTPVANGNTDAATTSAAAANSSDVSATNPA